MNLNIIDIVLSHIDFYTVAKCRLICKHFLKSLPLSIIDRYTEKMDDHRIEYNILPNGKKHGDKIKYNGDNVVSITPYYFGYIHGYCWEFAFQFTKMWKVVYDHSYGWEGHWYNNIRTCYKYRIDGLYKYSETIEFSDDGKTVQKHNINNKTASTTYKRGKKWREFIKNTEVHQLCYFVNNGITVVYYYEFGPKPSRLESYYSNGNLHISVGIDRIGCNTVPYGNYIKYYQNGRKCEEGEYSMIIEDDKWSKPIKIGKWKKWSRSGILIQDMEYDREGILIKGLKIDNWGRKI
jgi:hypothetical protein